jgi:hypothetical protein
MLGVTRAVAVLACLCPLVGTAEAQPRVDPRSSYERILAVVPLIGSAGPGLLFRLRHWPACTSLRPR